MRTYVVKGTYFLKPQGVMYLDNHVIMGGYLDFKAF
jgi:hypothetical protein